MGSFTGDLLRYLVHSGLNVGGKILGEAVAEPMKERRAQKQIESRLGIQNLLGTAAKAKQEELPGIQDTLAKLTQGRIQLPVGPEGNIIQPPTDPTHLIAERFRQDPKAMSDYLNLKTGGVTEAKLAELATRERGQDLTAAIKERDVAMRESLLPYKQAVMSATADARLNAVEVARLKLDIERAKGEKKEKTDADKQLEAQRTHYEKQLGDYLRLVKDPNADAEVKWKAASDYNTLVQTLPASLKPLMSHHSPFKLEEEPGLVSKATGGLLGGTKKTIGAGGQVGPAPSAAPSGGSNIVDELTRRAKGGDKAAQKWLKDKGVPWQ